MNIHTPRHFVPPRPDIPEASVSWYGFLRALRTNALQIWPRDAYTKDVLEQSFFRRKRFLLNAPDAIHRVLVDNIENYRRTRATIRILRPITGEGLFLSEGDEWRHQRRTIAPTLAPRVIPMLARHIVEVADVALARLDAAAAQPIDMLAAMQFLALEVAARSMFSLEMNRYGPALRRMIKSFSADLGRPYFLDLMLPVGIPSPRDFARMRFRRRWIALMDEVLAARQREPAERSAARPVRRAARGARPRDRCRVLAEPVARPDGDHDRRRPRDDGADHVLVALPPRLGAGGAKPRRAGGRRRRSLRQKTPARRWRSSPTPVRW